MFRELFLEKVGNYRKKSQNSNEFCDFLKTILFL